MNSRFTTGAGIVMLASAIAACAGGGSASQPIVPSGPALSTPQAVVPHSAVPVSTASPGTFKAYTLGGLSAYKLSVGPDRLYFPDTASKAIGSLTYDGVPGASNGDDAPMPDGSIPTAVTEGIDGAMYVSEAGSNLGRVQPRSSGNAPIVTLWNDFGVALAQTNGNVSDPKGVVWFSEFKNDSIVGMTTWGSLIKRTALTAGSHPLNMTIGADRNSIWVTEEGLNQIAKLDLSGNLIGEYPIGSGCGSAPSGIATGGDGNVYFTENVNDYPTHVSSPLYQSYIGRVTPSGVVTCFAAPNLGSTSGIAEGPDGNIWFAENESAQIVEFNLTTSTMGSPISLSAHGVSGNPQDLVLGADGQLWFVTNPGAQIASYHP